jgi:hypothetical protein
MANEIETGDIPESDPLAGILKDMNYNIAKFIDAQESHMFLQAMFQCEVFRHFMRTTYAIGIDNQQDLTRIYRQVDGKVLITFRTKIDNEGGGITIETFPIEDGIDRVYGKPEVTEEMGRILSIKKSIVEYFSNRFKVKEE